MVRTARRSRSIPECVRPLKGSGRRRVHRGEAASGPGAPRSRFHQILPLDSWNQEKPMSRAVGRGSRARVLGFHPGGQRFQLGLVGFRDRSHRPGGRCSRHAEPGRSATTRPTRNAMAGSARSCRGHGWRRRHSSGHWSSATDRAPGGLAQRVDRVEHAELDARPVARRIRRPWAAAFRPGQAWGRCRRGGAGGPRKSRGNPQGEKSNASFSASHSSALP